MKRDKYFGLSSRIARWKIDKPFERWLGHMADSSEVWKRLYVFYYKIFDNKYYRNGLPIIKSMLGVHKQVFRNYSSAYVVRDMVYSLHRFGLSFQDYCIYGLVNRTPQCRDSFVADKLRYYYCDILNAARIEQLMTDKFACYIAYKRFYKRDVVGCHNTNDKETFIDFISRHDVFIFKPINEHSGHGIKIMHSSAINPEIFFTEKIKMGGFVLEELIQQGMELAAIHPQSINSVRVVTFVINGDVKIIGATLRIGCGNSYVDNAGSGGMFASVDIINGIIQTDAINYKGEHFNFHPNTGIQIVGFKLPQWSEALILINEMATNIEGTTLISWDIAYSDKGWVMVEANDNGAWGILQSNMKIGLKPILFSYMDEYFHNQK